MDNKDIGIMSHNILCVPCGSPDGKVYGRHKKLLELFSLRSRHFMFSGNDVGNVLIVHYVIYVRYV